MGSGDESRRIGVDDQQVIEWIAFNVYGNPAAPVITGLEIKYHNYDEVVRIGKIVGPRVVMSFDVKQKEGITELRLDCGGQNDDKWIQYISISTNLAKNLVGGKMNRADSHVFKVGGKQIASFRGYASSSGVMRSLGLEWVRVGLGKWAPKA